MMNDDAKHEIPDNPKSLLCDKLQETRNEVNEVFQIMQNNLTKVLERDEKLHDLDERADAMLINASSFQAGAQKLKRKMWWKNLKMMIILCCIGAFLLILIIYFCFAS